MKKPILTILAVFTAALAFSQSVDDAIKLCYYGKFKSARDIMQKIVAGKPKDAYSIYWLGQTYLMPPTSGRDVASAKTLYQKAMTDGVNDPWIWIGMGEVQLLDANPDVNSAKQKFEQAITSTTGKGRKGSSDASILDAVGRANAAGDAKQGDPNYGIDKLKQAAAINPKDPDIFINMGICYLKLGSEHGGEAVEAFNQAISVDPKNARAMYRIGLVYASQNNFESMSDWYNRAIAADNTFSPVYLAYFDWYKDKDVNAAKDYVDQYVKYADQDCATSYFQADYLFRAGKYEESNQKAKAMEAGACKDFYRYYVIYAYNNTRLKDTAAAIAALDNFFTKASPTAIELTDYQFAGDLSAHVAGQQDKAVKYLTTAMAMDTVKANTMMYYDTIAYAYRTAGNAPARLDYLRRSWAINPKPSNLDIYNLGMANMDVKNYAGADSAWSTYVQKLPDQPTGYAQLVKSAQAQDSTGAKSVAPINNYIAYLSKDTAKYNKNIAYYHAILAGYYANTAKNLDSAGAQFEMAVAADPTNPQYAAYLAQVKKAIDQRNHPRTPAPPARKPSATKGGR